MSFDFSWGGSPEPHRAPCSVRDPDRPTRASAAGQGSRPTELHSRNQTLGLENVTASVLRPGRPIENPPQVKNLPYILRRCMNMNRFAIIPILATADSSPQPYAGPPAGRQP